MNLLIPHSEDLSDREQSGAEWWDLGFLSLVI